MENDHYATLGVEEGVDARTLRAAYLARMRVHHPDRSPGDPGDHARELNRAYEVLRDPVRRAAYDRIRRARGSGHRLGQAHRYVDVPGGHAGPGQAASWRVSGSAPVVNGHARPAAPRGARRVENAAYSEDYGRYYRTVTAAMLRIGAAVFALGIVLILLLSG